MDIKLVKKAIKGNEKAFEMLVKADSERIYKTAFLYVRNREDALDVMQESIYKAYMSVRSVKQPEYFKTWLTSIVIRTALDILRKRKRLILDEDIVHMAESDPENLDERIDLLQAITKLSSEYQTAIILFYFHDMTILKVAETMGKSENTIKTYLRRARIELKSILKGARYYEQEAFSN